MIERIAWSVLALVHAVPALSFFRPSMLQSLYGLEAANPLYLLMHHRAALFLVIFVICIWCAVSPTPRQLGVVAVAISMVSFLILYWMAGSPPPLRSIAIADLVGMPALLYVAWRAFS